MMASVFASMLGMLTALRTSPSSSAARICCAISQPDAFLRLRRRGAEMRREDEIRQPRNGSSAGSGSSSKTSSAAAATCFVFERLDQRRFVDQPAARAIDDAHALFALASRSALSMCFVSAVSGMCSVMKSACGSDLIELFDEFDLQRTRATGGKIRIVSEHAHAESDGPPRDLRADAAHAENGERLVVELDAFKVFSIPLAGLHARVRLRDVARRSRP